MVFILPEIPAERATRGPEQPSQHRLAIGSHALAQAAVSFGARDGAFGAIVVVVLLAACVSAGRNGAEPRAVVAGHEDAA